MKKLFKEVWKSFSKSKIILIGLTLLVFLTSGIITLLSDVINKYQTQYDDYKKTSVLQDITMNSNINPTGTKPKKEVIKDGKKTWVDNIFIPETTTNMKNQVDNVWVYEEDKGSNKHLESIRINTKNKFVNLKDLNSQYQDSYVSTKDLSYLLNSNISSITTIPENPSDKAYFSPNTKQINQLVKYNNSTNEVEKKQITSIKTISTVIKTGVGIFAKYNVKQTSKISDLLTINGNDFQSLLIDSKGNAYIANDVFLDPDSKAQPSKQYQTQPLSFSRIDKRQVAQLFGFTKKDIYEQTPYEFKKYEGIEQVINSQQLDSITTPNSLKSLTFKNNIDLSLNNTFTKPLEVIITTTLESNKQLLIPNDWFVYSKDIYRFTQHKFKFNDDLNQWSGMYRDYLSSIKPKDVNESNTSWDELTKELTYWDKTIQSVLVDNTNKIVQEGKQLKVSIIKDDLSYQLKKEGSPENAPTQNLLQIEQINQNPSTEIANKLNTDFRSEKQNLLESNSKKYAYTTMYNQIKDVFDKIGIRENITVNSNEDSKTTTYQFINIGEWNKETNTSQLNWNGINVNQEVGKLINDPTSSQIYSVESNLNSSANEVPQNELPKILDKLLTGLSLDRQYINPMISFQTFKYDENGIQKTQSNAKIIWLTPNGVNDRNQLIGLSTIRDTTNGTKKYYVVEEKNKGLFDWETIAVFSTNKEMEDFIIKNNMKFAPFDMNGNEIKVVGKNGWLSQNNNYKNEYYVPFQYLLPSSKIIEEFNTNGSLQIFADNLILKLTQNVKPIINATNWELLMNAVSTGFSRSGFGDGLTPPAAITTQTIANIVVFTLRDATIATNQNFVNSFLTDIFSGIQNQMKKYSNDDPILKKEYLKNEFNKLGEILKLTTGMDISSILVPIVDSLKDPDLLLDGLKLLINAFDLDQAVIQLYEAMKSPNRKKDEILTSADYLPLIYQNMKNPESIKNGLKNIINSIDLKDLATKPGFEILGSFAGIINESIINLLINLLNITNPAIGYSSLVNQIIYEHVKWGNEKGDYSATLKRIGDNSLKSFLNLLYIKDSFRDIKFYIGDLVGNKLPDIDVIYDPAFLNPLELDLDLLWFLKNYVLTPEIGTIFGVRSIDILLDATEGFTQIKNDDNQIKYNENASKIALVNEAFLKENNKSVYQSNTLAQDLNDLSKIDDKYKISVANVEYVITGTNLTADYIYPVLNSENIQVNPKNQALVYVNQYGFDRIKSSNVNSPTDKYFLLSGIKGNKSLSIGQEELNKIAYYWITGGGLINSEFANSDNNPYKKAYLFDEYQIKNPEYSLRITTINKLLDILPKIQMVVAIALGLITAIVISFVVRRYISSRAKVIGILKAQGYSSLQITLSICLFPLIVSLIGGSLGYIWGHFAQLRIFQLLSIFWTIPITTAAFNWMTLTISIVVPFVLLSLLTIVVTLWFLRKNSITLMNGSLEVNDSQYASFTKKMTQKTSIKNKFSTSLALSSIGKLVALFLSALITSTITLFAFTSYNIFDKSVSKTYENRDFTYKTDLTTPTIEGGEYTDIFIDKGSQLKLNNNIVQDGLYVPLGVVQEGYTYLNNYFKPGFNNVINQKIKIMQDGKEVLVDANGTLDPNNTTTPHIFTKSSIDLTVLAGGLKINVWENLYNAIPESQRASIIKTSQNAAQWLEWTQEGKRFIDPKTKKEYITKFVNFDSGESEYLTVYDVEKNEIVQVWDNSLQRVEDIRIPYFNYIRNTTNPEKSHFVYRKTTDVNSKYFDSTLKLDGVVNNNTIRYAYRNFLVDGYNLMFNWSENSLEKLPFERAKMPEYTLDYFIIPGANMLNLSTSSANNDETYTFVDSTTNNNFQNIRIYGYNPKSQLIKVVNANGNNLLESIENYQSNDGIYPIFVNEVAKQKYQINTNDIIELTINNHYLRNQDKLKEALNKANNINTEIKPRIVKVKVLGIIDTYINDEWVTTQEIANKIIGINTYNGILTNNNEPIQLANSLSLYSPNGYWSANESIDNLDPSVLSQSQAKDLADTYKQLFYISSSKDYNDTNLNTSLVANNIRAIVPNITNEQVNLAIKSLLGLGQDSSLDIIDKNGIHDALNKFANIYTNKSLQAALNNATSNGVEKEYAINASSTINQGMLIIVSISFSISLIILVMISVMIINENERNIAIFGILGYSTKEKIRMFFSIYVPIVLLSMLLSILFVWLFIPLFSSSILATSSIALPLGLSFVKVIISSLAVASIFSITCLIAWLIQGRINPIILLKV